MTRISRTVRFIPQVLKLGLRMHVSLSRSQIQRILVALFGIVLSFNSYGEWTRIGRTTQATIFVERDTIRRAGSMVKLWTLTNFTTPDMTDGKTSQSSKAQFEYDCKEERSRVLAIYMYSLPNGKGDVNGTEIGPEPWYPVVPKSMAFTLWSLACK